MANALFVIPTLDLARWSGFVMNATTEATKVDALFVEELAYQMPTIARSAQFKKKM